MTTVHENIATYLNSVSGITNLVVDRISPGDLPQGTAMPAITFRRVSNVRHHARRFVTPRWQINCWDETPLKAEELAQQVRTALEGFHSTMNGMHVVSVVVNDADDHEPNSGLYRVMTDVRFTYEEP